MAIKHQADVLISDVRLYLTKDGAVVEEGDPAANSLLVPAGVPIPSDVAERHGLKASAKRAAEEQKPPAVEEPKQESKTFSSASIRRGK